MRSSDFRNGSMLGALGSLGVTAVWAKAAGLEIRFYLDPESGEPHIHRHGVTEREVEDVLRRALEDAPGKDGARVAVGRTSGGRMVRVIYVPDSEYDSVFVVTAYTVWGQALRALRRRLKKKP